MDQNKIPINSNVYQSTHQENHVTGNMDMWYQERHGLEISFGLHVKKTLMSEKSQYQQVNVFDSTGFGRVLTLDGLMMCTERDEFVYHEMIAHVPLLSHPNPKAVLIIGGGDGGTLREVLKHPSVERAVLCEIDGLVVQAAKNHFPCFSEAFEHPNAEVCIEDGVEFVKNAKDASFDVVLVDSADPIGPGVGLFSKDFYLQVKRILRPGGIVAAQCESPWDDKINLAKVYQNLQFAGNKVYAMTGSIPSYPFGFWSWAIASDQCNPFEIQGVERAIQIEKTARYYNTDIHRSALVLPNFLRKKLSGVVINA